MFDLDLLFQKSDLIPVVIQEQGSGKVLMLGFTNREALENTIRTKTAWFWSRDRQKLGTKGRPAETISTSKRFSLTATPIPCSIFVSPRGRYATRELTVAFSTGSSYNV